MNNTNKNNSNNKAEAAASPAASSPRSASPFFTRLNRNIVLDYWYSFINNLNMSSSIWVLYLAYRGMNLMQIGLLEGLFHATSMICEVPSGAVADLWGRRRTLIAGQICMAVSCIIMLFARSFPFFALGFIIQAFSYNLKSGSEEALLYDSMKLCGREEQYLRVNGRLNFLIEVAQAIATVSGGILAEYSYNWCYGACLAIALLGIFPACLMTEPQSGHTEDHSADRLPLTTLLKNHFQTSLHILREQEQIRRLVMYYSVIFMAYTLLFFYSQQYFYDLGLNKISISVIMLFAGAISCLGALASEWLYTYLKNRLVYLASCSIALGLIGFGFHRLLPAIAALLLASFFNSVLYPVQSISLNRLIPSGQRATLISVNSMAFSVAMLLCFPLAGGLAEALGLPIIFAILGALLMLGTILVHRLHIL